MAAENRFAKMLTTDRQSLKNTIKSDHIDISDFWISKHETAQFAFPVSPQA